MGYFSKLLYCIVLDRGKTQNLSQLPQRQNENSSLMLNQALGPVDARGSGGINPHIPNFDTRWK